MSKKWSFMVTVLCKGQPSFYLHPLPLAEKSYFFAQVLAPMGYDRSEGSKDGEHVVVDIPEIEAENFGVYELWVNDSRLDYHLLQPEFRETNTLSEVPYFVKRYLSRPIEHTTAEEIRELKDHSAELARRLMFLWIDAMFLGDTKLQDKVMDELAKYFLDDEIPSFIPMSTIVSVGLYTECTPGCQLREFCIDYVDHRTVAASDNQFGAEEPPVWLLKGLSNSSRRLIDDPKTAAPRTLRGPGWYNAPAVLPILPLTYDKGKGAVCRIRHECNDDCPQTSKRKKKAQHK